ncbi:hypothetical protein [Arthrobacter pityocampae]|uniref:hypothetical protein n=1 Tax=Arthrobacter pityocampae TaxID=547334 RepID=UPI003736443F
MDETTTPADLSRELGVDAKRIRDFLREQYGLLPPHATRWLLNQERADAVRTHFRTG